MRRNLKKAVKISGVALIFLLVMMQVAFALDPQGYGDGKYPFNDDMSSLWSIPSEDYNCVITTYGETGDPPSNTDAGNYEHVHWTYYVLGFPKFDMDCHAWVCRYNTGGNDYVLVVTRMDVSCYGVIGENTVRDMEVKFIIPDDWSERLFLNVEFWAAVNILGAGIGMQCITFEVEIPVV